MGRKQWEILNQIDGNDCRLGANGQIREIGWSEKYSPSWLLIERGVTYYIHVNQEATHQESLRDVLRMDNL